MYSSCVNLCACRNWYSQWGKPEWLVNEFGFCLPVSLCFSFWSSAVHKLTHLNCKIWISIKLPYYLWCRHLLHLYTFQHWLQSSCAPSQFLAFGVTDNPRRLSSLIGESFNSDPKKHFDFVPSCRPSRHWHPVHVLTVCFLHRWTFQQGLKPWEVGTNANQKRFY